MAQTTSSSKSEFCVPGQRLSESNELYYGGRGTYVLQNYIYSSVAGKLIIRKEDKINIVEVQRGAGENRIPTPGTIVTVKVTSINLRFAKCVILCIESTVLKESFRGVIRKEDVRQTRKDTVEMYRCMRPGDVVIARVISIGDAHSYYLTTAENELGVVIAQSEAGVAMVPISWTEMQCPKTLIREERKVARIYTNIVPSEIS